jgi:hypothetical protein
MKKFLKEFSDLVSSFFGPILSRLERIEQLHMTKGEYHVFR